MSKKHEFRFTLVFHADEPRQRQVAEILNSMGRRKAAYITSAVLHYISVGNYVGLEAEPPEAFQQMIEQEVKRALQDHLGRQDICMENAAPIRMVPRKKKTIDELKNNDTDVSTLSEQDLKDIHAAIQSFRK